MTARTRDATIPPPEAGATSVHGTTAARAAIGDRGARDGRPLPLTVAQRLGLGLLPALLAVGLVVGLAYWGEYGRRAPTVVVIGAAALTLASLALTWYNARDLGRRVAHLSATVAQVHRLVDDATGDEGTAGTDATSDELRRTERVLRGLGDALAAAREERRRTEAAVLASRRTQALLVERSAADARARLDELRLPLHILLESRFGTLNENQEELLTAARAAGDAMDVVLRRLERVAAADGGTLPVQRALLAPNDVVRAVEAQARAITTAHGVRLDVALEPAPPRAWADRAKLAEALVLLIADAARRAGAGGALHVRTEAESGRAVIVVTLQPETERAIGAGAATSTTASIERSADVLLAGGLLGAQGADVETSAFGCRVRLPTAAE